MVASKLLSLHDQCFAPLLADEDNRHQLRWFIDAKQHPVLDEESQLAPSDGVWPQGLHLARFDQRVFLQAPEGLLQELPSVPLPEPAEIIEYGLLQFHNPSHARHSRSDQNSGQWSGRQASVALRDAQ